MPWLSLHQWPPPRGAHTAAVKMTSRRPTCELICTPPPPPHPLIPRRPPSSVVSATSSLARLILPSMLQGIQFCSVCGFMLEDVQLVGNAPFQTAMPSQNWVHADEDGRQLGHERHNRAIGVGNTDYRTRKVLRSCLEWWQDGLASPSNLSDRDLIG